MIKKIVKNPPFGMSMQAATRAMAKAKQPIAEAYQEQRIAAAAERRKARAEEISKRPTIKGSITDPDWRRDDSSLPMTQQAAIAKTEREINELPGTFAFAEVVGSGLRQRMQHGRIDPTFSPVPADLDRGARELNAYSVMCQIAAQNGAGDLADTPEGSRERFEDLTDMIDDAGAAYSLLTGKDWENGEPLEMSSHKRLEAIRNFPNQELLSDMKMLHAKGTSKLTQRLEGYANEFCAAVDTRAQMKLETPLRVKRRSNEMVR